MPAIEGPLFSYLLLYNFIDFLYISYRLRYIMYGKKSKHRRTACILAMRGLLYLWRTILEAIFTTNDVKVMIASVANDRQTISCEFEPNTSQTASMPTTANNMALRIIVRAVIR